MEFDDISKAKEILSDIGYYRFVFFSFSFEKTYPLKVKYTHEVVEGTTFKQIYDLYEFDSQLRFILTKALTRIEINIRTRLTPTWGTSQEAQQRKICSGMENYGIYDFRQYCISF